MSERWGLDALYFWLIIGVGSFVVILVTALLVLHCVRLRRRGDRRRQSTRNTHVEKFVVEDGTDREHGGYADDIVGEANLNMPDAGVNKEIAEPNTGKAQYTRRSIDAQLLATRDQTTLNEKELVIGDSETDNSPSKHPSRESFGFSGKGLMGSSSTTAIKELPESNALERVDTITKSIRRVKSMEERAKIFLSRIQDDSSPPPRARTQLRPTSPLLGATESCTSISGSIALPNAVQDPEDPPQIADDLLLPCASNDSVVVPEEFGFPDIKEVPEMKPTKRPLTAWGKESKPSNAKEVPKSKKKKQKGKT